MTAHAEFGMSGLAALRRCPGKYHAEKGLPDQTSTYAERGTLMHEVSEKSLKAIPLGESLFMSAHKNMVHDACVRAKLNEKEAGIVMQYVEYVCDLKGDLREVEVRVTPVDALKDKCWGTADVILFVGDDIHVIDLKTGQGVKVFAEDNEQALGYALGAIREYEAIYGPFTNVHLHIVQPALDHYDVASYTAQEVIDFGFVIRQIVSEAENPNAQRIPGEKQCKFCRARFTCTARAQEMLRTAFEDFGDTPAPTDLTLEQIGELLPRLSAVTDWIGDIKDYALKHALDGAPIPGHKLVEGISRRRITDEHEAARRLAEAGLDDYEIYKPKEIFGITELEKAVGKKKFASLLVDLLEKPEGKPTLVPLSDKRPPLESKNSAKADFS